MGNSAFILTWSCVKTLVVFDSFIKCYGLLYVRFYDIQAQTDAAGFITVSLFRHQFVPILYHLMNN